MPPEWVQTGIIGACYAIGAGIGWRLMDKWLNARARKREEREAQMRDVTPR